jgi:hypothetical protein
MIRFASIFRFALLAGAATQLHSAFGAWGEMRSGMSRADAADAIGQPAIIGIGRGFETWSFEHGGEVLLYRGSVLYWTVPKVGAELAPLKKSDRPAPGPVSRPVPPVLHAAHNCTRVDCPIHSPPKQVSRK